MAIVIAKKTFTALNPENGLALNIVANSFVRNGNHFEFADSTGIVAFIPANFIVALKDNIVNE